MEITARSRMRRGGRGEYERKPKAASIRKRLLMGFFLPVIGTIFIWLIGKTIRIERVDADYEREVMGNGRSFIYSFWHGRIFYFSYFYRRRKINVLISRSQDGELIARVIRLLGYRTSRGSTTGGGGSRALMKMAKYMRDTLHPTSICPDGPRGPRYRATRGVVFLASISGCPILPMSNSFKRVKVFQSWDRFVLPFPFTRGVIIYGEPVKVPLGASDEVLEEKVKELEDKLNEITYRADNYFSPMSDLTLTHPPSDRYRR